MGETGMEEEGRMTGRVQRILVGRPRIEPSGV